MSDTLVTRPPRRPEPPMRDVAAVAVIVCLAVGNVLQSCEAQRTARAAVGRLGR